MTTLIELGSESATTRSRSREREKDSEEDMERTPHSVYRECNEAPAFSESRDGNRDFENSWVHESPVVCLRSCQSPEIIRRGNCFSRFLKLAVWPHTKGEQDTDSHEYHAADEWQLPIAGSINNKARDHRA